MAFDRGLEERLYEHFSDRPDLTVRKMFGGLCFMLSGHMCCAIIGDPDHQTMISALQMLAKKIGSRVRF
ncbi:hypothetical protein [Psychromonas algicola]|uniref:hypothetical protein n=1 Tax=Psychromonas algicola TaxID=2555642 RepID=UPI0032637CC7